MARAPAAIAWLRRDLRVHDHPALTAALGEADTVIPVFCLDDRLLGGAHLCARRVRFMLESLADLRTTLAGLGGGLVVVHGRPEVSIVRLARATGAKRVHFGFDVGEFARRRDGQVVSALRAIGAEAVAHPGVFALENPRALVSGAGTPYGVFTPFHRAWEARRRRSVLPAPVALPALPEGLRHGRLPDPAELAGGSGPASGSGSGSGPALGSGSGSGPALGSGSGSGPALGSGEALAGGERAGRAALAAWLAGPVRRYADTRDDLGADGGVSRLSSYLRFGCLSPRELEDRLEDDEGSREYRRQLAWRDFFGYTLHHFPNSAREELNPRYRGTIDWRDDEPGFKAWCEGRTGVPLVDASMRQLLSEGWIHNRARLVAGSFLTKDLGIDWRRGAAHFMAHLLDGDPASNTGNWQWIASTGADPAPVYRRILSPTRQQRRFDPDGIYVRRHVPELAPVPDRYLAEPWTMPPAVEAACGVRIGRDYPPPIVDHALARREALARYAGAAGR